MTYDKLKLLEDCNWECECGCGGRAEDGHHCLISRNRNFAKFLDVEENIVMITHKENVDRKFDNAEGRKKFFRLQVEKYGEERMLKWLKSLPTKLLLGQTIDFASWTKDKIIFK